MKWKRGMILLKWLKEISYKIYLKTLWTIYSKVITWYRLKYNKTGYIYSPYLPVNSDAMLATFKAKEEFKHYKGKEIK